MFKNLREFLDRLRRERDLVVVSAPVDPRLEIAEIHRRVIAEGGPALLFTNPTGASFPIVTNLFGTPRRVDLAFGPAPERFVRDLARAAVELLPPTPAKLWQSRSLLFQALRVGTTSVSRAPVLEMQQSTPQLSKLPILTSAPLDGGPFITLPIVYTEHPDPKMHQSNLGMYRLQSYDDRTTGFHAQIGKGGGFHHYESERRGQNLPLTVFLGGPPALTLAAIAPLPEGIPELLLASLVRGKRLEMVKCPAGGHRLVAEAEFAIRGSVRAGARRLEGPFGDHYGYYSLAHEYPIFDITNIWHRRDAIYPATVVGKPRQEDFFLGDYLQQLLSPLFPLVMPAVVDLWSYGDTGFHSLSAAIVKDRYGREALASAFRILGEGQLSLTKFLLVTDGAVDLKNFKSTLEHILSRCDFAADLFIFANVSMDTLDYTGPKVNEGSKGVLLGLGPPRRELPAAFAGPLPAGANAAALYCAGCLVVSGPMHASSPNFAASLARDPAIQQFPLVILADDARATAASTEQFLWRVFTRFEPAGDIHSNGAPVVRHHLAYNAPIVIDARVKSWFPGEVDADEATSALVSRRWREYFPQNAIK
ncbi:MAG: UbiD family decarboxylase [Planctomycetes bacterium]|nr:UbiD family decarboxylase [Planctomycetota bacterium]